MVPKESYQFRCDVNSALAVVERPVVNGADNCVLCYVDYGSYNM